MTWMGTEIVILAAILAACSTGSLVLGWFLGRWSTMQGFRMGRISQGQADVILADKRKARNEITRLGDEYDPYAEAMKDPATKTIGTIEGERT